eukprot:scaffold5605_cov142-Skeletonema_marinoi.AAC.2
MMFSSTMAAVTYNHPTCQFRRAQVAAKIIAYASEAATVRSRFGRYEIIVAISGIKSAIFNSVRPYYRRFGDNALQVKDPSRT